MDPLASFRLDGRVAVVTGASSGLGARFARVLTAVGARTALVARREERVAALAEELDGAMAIRADVGRPEDVERMVGDVIAKMGRVDVLVNNAGIGDVVAAEDEDLDQFAEVVRVNLTAAFHASQVAARQMLQQGSGSIINVASILGYRSAGTIPQAGYAASKGGLINLTRELAAQWSRRGIRVNALCPGWFHTEMNDEMFAQESGHKYVRRKTILGRVGEEHELDGAVLWLASDASSYVTGTSVVVDGGFLAM